MLFLDRYLRSARKNPRPVPLNPMRLRHRWIDRSIGHILAKAKEPERREPVAERRRAA